MDAAFAPFKVADLAVLGDFDQLIKLFLPPREFTLFLELFVSFARCGHLFGVVRGEGVVLETDFD